MSRSDRTSGARRSPLQIDVIRLGKRPGAMLEVSETVPSPSRIGLDMIAIEKGAPLRLDLQLQSVSEGVLVTGTVSAPTVGECSRCLQPFDDHVEVDLTELYAYPDSATAQTTEDDETPRVVDDMIDLEQAIVDAVGLELPLSPVCSEDCPGLCPSCGVVLADQPEHRHESFDPRWAKLSGLLDDSDNGQQP